MRLMPKVFFGRQDKTFGLKNKKGAKTQKFIQMVEKQVKSGGQHPLDAKPDARKLEKEKKAKVSWLHRLPAALMTIASCRNKRNSPPYSSLSSFRRSRRAPTPSPCSVRTSNKASAQKATNANSRTT